MQVASWKTRVGGMVVTNTIGDTKKDYQTQNVGYGSKPIIATSTPAETAIVQAGRDAIIGCLLSLARLPFFV